MKSPHSSSTASIRGSGACLHATVFFFSFFLNKFIKTHRSKINTALASLKIYRTNFKIYYKNTNNLPRYSQILIILLFVNIY